MKAGSGRRHRRADVCTCSVPLSVRVDISSRVVGRPPPTSGRSIALAAAQEGFIASTGDGLTGTTVTVAPGADKVR
jgi:hypothetical protein